MILKDLKDEVRKTYDSIAPSFSKKRTTIWPPTRSFLDGLKPSRLIDIGSGAGRVMKYALLKGFHVTGVDISGSQIEATRLELNKEGILNGYELVQGDMEELPFKDDTFDNGVMIASLHHLPTRESRIRSLVEASRVIISGGELQISVWTWDQDRFREGHLKRVGNERPLTDEDGPSTGDFYVPWKDGEVKQRFYHLYGHGELDDEVDSAGLSIIRSYFDGRNHWIEARVR
jgi:ubiquinone/menaquinone biosynthesis C-methylase UbiE